MVNVNEENVIRIRQLPEKGEIFQDDWLVVEDDNDTWKVHVSKFKAFIDEAVESLEGLLSGNLEDKLTIIQQEANKITESINMIQSEFDKYAEAEKQRVQNELDRVDAEFARNQTYDQIVLKETARESNEIKREEQYERSVTLYNNTVQLAQDITNAENLRDQAEQNRVDAELNRGIAEGERQDAEAARVVAENQRKTNENGRVDSFNEMTTYINNLKANISTYIKQGISRPTDDTNKIVKIMEINVPITNAENYESLLFISKISDDGCSDILISLGISFSGTVPEIEIQLADDVPDTQNIIDSINAYYTIVDNRVNIAIEYNAAEPGIRVKTAVVWENITMFRKDGVLTCSTVLRDFTPIGQFTSVNVLSLIDIEQSSYPKLFLELFNNVSYRIQDALENMPPYYVYPVGSVYMTTLDKDPSEILGGGSWKLLYESGVTENITVDGVDTYSPVIYYWERVEVEDIM